MDKGRYRAAVTQHASLAFALLAVTFVAGCSTGEPTAAPSPSATYAPVAAGALCEDEGAAAVDQSGATLTCVYHRGRATWQSMAPTPPPTSVPATTAPAMKPTIDEGVWTVGLDISPGTYRVAAPVEDDCYWAITKSGSNGEDIISNHIVSGGRPTVVLKRGQDFESSRCGTWEKVK